MSHNNYTDGIIIIFHRPLNYVPHIHKLKLTAHNTQLLILLRAKFNYFVFSCGIKICLEDNDNYDAQNYSLEHQIEEYDLESN